MIFLLSLIVAMNVGAPVPPSEAAAAVDDAIWYAGSARFDPKTETFGRWPIPSGGGVIRNMAPAPAGGGLALACSGVDMVAIVEIAEGTAKGTD